ncbi:MAG: hypothetical protein ASARMPRED_003724 [Alectoria sarmentosa]|nr:MAG: hypothetical protein ASARMPRED_003724 [Alectoria sarmentosa]
MGAPASSQASKTSPRASRKKNRHADWQHSLHFQSRSQEATKQKEYEEWEDQLIISHRNAGKSWKSTHQKIRLTHQDATSQELNSLPIPADGEMERWRKWEEWEDELLTSLYAKGKSWEYISLRIPRHTPKASKKMGLEALDFRNEYFENAPDPRERVDAAAVSSDGMDLDHTEDPSFSVPTLKRNQHVGVDLRKRKLIDIPTV